MTISQKLTIELIRYEISATPANPELLEAVNDEVLEAVYKFATEQDIAYIVGSALSKLNLLSGDAKTAFFNEQLASVYRYEGMKHELENITNLLETEGIAFMPLKGSVIRELYPKPEMRTSCDIDVLIHKEDCPAAINALVEKLNYTRLSNSTLHDYQFVTPAGVHVELHYTLLEDDCIPKAGLILKDIWDHASPIDNCQYHMRMTNEMFMYYHIVHMAKHFLRGGCGTKPFIDLLILQRKMPFDNDILTHMLGASSLLSFYNAVTDLSNVWFANSEHSEITKQMEKFIFDGGVYGNTVNSAAVSASRGESKLKSFLHLMFLPRQNLEVIYPKLKNKPYLLPYYHIKRLCRVFNKDKRKKITTLTLARNSVTNDKVDSVGNMLHNLELI